MFVFKIVTLVYSYLDDEIKEMGGTCGKRRRRERRRDLAGKPEEKRRLRRPMRIWKIIMNGS
jgi:hypothetical protein